MASESSDGIKLYTEVGTKDAPVEEEKVPSVPYNHQLTPSSSDTMLKDSERAAKSDEVQPEIILHKTPEASPSVISPMEAENKELSGFNYDRVSHPTVVKRTRGRPRKDCQRPAKHHLGQSAATKVFPGRPRIRGRKHLQHYFLTHPSQKVQDIQSALDVYEDIDSDIKSSCEISEKMLISSNAVPDNELKIEKFCALCNLSEKSLLGQGKLKNFKPSEGFNCFEEMEKKVKEKSVEVTSSCETGSELKLFFKKQKLMNSPGDKIHRSKSFQILSEKPSMLTDLIQELEVTGFKAVPESSVIFEPSGELYAHFNCAAWSDGVSKTFEKLLSNVDKAVVVAAFQKCSKCSRFGASVRCCVSDCTKIYHYPCAIVDGALQNANCFKIICSVHLEDAFSFGVICMACHESGDLSQLLLCTSCSNYYHGSCMDSPIVPSPDVRAGWQCLDCKVCQNCRQPDDSSKMIICNTCDKGYHCFCVKPAISSVPKSGWKCSACRMCGDCGARTPGNGPSSRWHMNYSVCDSCYQQRNKGIACPLCGRAYRQFSQRKSMKHCTVCQKYIHEECHKKYSDGSRRSSMDYVCPVCVAPGHKNIEGDEHHIKDNFLLASSRDSFLSGNDDSFTSDSEEGFDGVHSKISHRRTSTEIRQKKTSKPKFKSFSIPNFLYSVTSAQKEYKMDDDDPTEDNKLILASATDEFVLCQDLCVMCGSFGKGEEGRLIACAQCGQCYHSYCVSVKVTTVVLKKGWRCLDCTVCEGCGQPHDEGRLLLCDECDISFHIYCLDPPLQEVPQGNWKCKWCVNCVKCGSKSPGLNCSWQVNYTLCGPCASFTICCVCQQHYEENDLVIQCGKCERWLHGICDQVENEDQAEKCAEYGYNCPHCRPSDELPPHLLPPPRTPTPEIELVPEKHPSPVSKPKEIEPPVVKTKPPVQLFLDGVCLSESGMKYIKSLAPEQPKKIPRPRKLKHTLSSEGPRLFNFGPSFDRIDDSTSAPIEEPKTETITPEEALKAYDFEEGKLVIDSSRDFEDKKKRPRKLQKLGIGGFSVKPRGRCSTGKDAVNEQAESNAPPSYEPSSIGADVCAAPTEASELNGIDKPKRKRKPKKKTHLDESFPSYLRDAFFGKDLLMSCKKLGKSVDVHEPGPDSKAASDDAFKGSSASDTKVLARVQEDVKDFIPTSTIVKGKDVNVAYKSLIKSEIESIKEEHLSSTSSLSSIDTSGLPQIDSKEVEDVFQGVLQDKRNPVQYLFPSGSTGAPKLSMPYAASSSGGNPAALHSSSMQNLQHHDSNSSWPDTECDQTQMQKNLLKWESDEQLGLLSTISPVLYANINLPHLKIEFPAWADRVKQIAKIWRGLPSEKRQPYLQRARENRAASRTQRSNSSDSERSQQKSSAAENEQEKQWRQLQAMRQLQQQAQQRLLQEQRVQAVLKSQAAGTMPPEMDKNLKLFHSKSLSEIPQFSNAAVVDDKDNRKVFEKRWSSSAIDLNTAQVLMQDAKIKIELQPSPVQPPFLKDCIQSPVIHSRSTVVHAPRIQTQAEPQITVSDTNLSSTTPVKSTEAFQASSSPAVTTQNVSQEPPMSAPIHISREVMNTPPATPRPHSSDSFFQLSQSPQSQLLASLDTHSQPSPASNKASSPKHFALQQGPLTVKQLSQYKETFGSLSNSTRHLMEAEKPLEQQNLEQLLRDSPLTLPFTDKVVPQHQQLRDLLQSKKVTGGSEDGKLGSPQTGQNILDASSIAKMCAESSTSLESSIPSAVDSFSPNLVPSHTASEKLEQRPQSEPSNDFILAENEKKTSSLEDVCLPIVSEKDEPKEEICANLNNKRKTTAADLVKDLETQAEEHDVIGSGCNLDALPADVGELELDDDELLGLGSDFNILEYADPELDKSLVGELDKNNILDEHLDLDDKDEELADDIKEPDPAQEKDLISQELSDEKADMDIDVKLKTAVDSEKDAALADSFLNLDKKDVGFENTFETKSSENPSVDTLTSTIKEEPKQVFSSCSLSSQTYSPNIDVKLEKSNTESCLVAKSQSLSFGSETQPNIQCPNPAIPPPSYRMMTATMKHQQGPIVQHSKGIFPLHISMNLRQDSQQSVISSAVVDANKPLLLQEQPLLLAELVEQEKREQRRQTQDSLISPHADALLSDIDFERLKDDVFSGPPDDSLGGPGLLGSHDPSLQAAVSPSLGVPSSPNSHNFGPPPYSLPWQNQEAARAVTAARPMASFVQNLKKAPVSTIVSSLGLPPAALAQKAQTLPGNIMSRPFNPNFVSTPVNTPPDDPEKLKLLNYEKQLLHQQVVLSTQQKYFETEVIRLRKMKKALNAKQRQLRKNGSELTENDSVELARVSQEQAGLQKQLDQVRKQTRQNTIALQDYRLKQQKRQQMLQQQSPQPVPRSPIHPSVQSSPQNSQSPLQFTHGAPLSPSASVRLQHSPSPLMQSPVSSSNSQPSTLFTPQLPLQLQMVKAENKSWQNQAKLQQDDLQREQLDRNASSQSFPLSSNSQPPQSDISFKGLSEESLKQVSNDCNLPVVTSENLDQAFASKPSVTDNITSQSLLLKDQKVETVSTVQSPVPQSILSQSLPSSVSNTLKFTLRQTGMPTGCLPTDSASSELPYAASADLPNKPASEGKPVAKLETCQRENSVDVQASSNKSMVKQEAPEDNQKPSVFQKSFEEEKQKLDENTDVAEEKKPPLASTDAVQMVHIKQEIMDDVPMDPLEKKESDSIKEQSDRKQKEEDNEGSSEEEIENITKMSAETEQGGEQNVLLKQLLQNCPSAETNRKSDTFIGIPKDNGDELNKLDLPFEVNDLQSKSKMIDPKLKKPSYLDIRRAQLEREPTPPPGEKPKTIKRKRPKKKKLDQPGKPEGFLAKKKCRRTLSKIEEGYETYAETLMNKLTSLPPLRILEPNIKPNFSAIPVFGAGDLNVKENQLKGRYGSSCVPDETDIYSVQPYTKEQPPSSAILPPSSPPYRGFYNQEFPTIAKAFEKNEMSLALKPCLEIEPCKVSQDAGSPDTVISSSSPESCIYEQPLSKWPKLIFVDKILPERKYNRSPVVPLLYPIPIRLYSQEWNELDEDKDKENIPDDKSEISLMKTKMSGIGGYSAPLKDSGNVAVTLTLSSAAAEDICGVLSALADLLKIPIPASYEIVERTATPPSQKLGLYRRSKNSEVSIHSLLNGKPRFCRHCDIVVLSAGIRKKAADLACISKDDQEEDDIIFCSTNCYMQFALTHRSTAMLEEKEAAAVVDHVGDRKYDKNYSYPEDSLTLDDKDALEGLKAEDMDVELSGLDSLSIPSDEKFLTTNPYDIDLLSDKMEIVEEEPVIRKWKSIKYKYWHSSADLSKKKEESSEKPPRPFYHTIKPSQMPKDERKCIFCHITGDGETNGAARLLNMDVNKWVHLNCALWSYEVYETVNGALMNVEVAFKRSCHLSCYSCHKQGASVRCFKTRCPNVYHFPCARKEQCTFYKDKTVLCPAHVHKGNPENRLESVAVFRRVYVNREEHKQVASMIQDDKYVMRVGSLIFLNIGQLLPTQIQAFHSPNCIYPVGYKVIRMYWSMKKLGRRSQYVCTINEVDGKPEFSIQLKDADPKDAILKDKTSKGVWQKVLYPIEKMRKQAKTIKIFPDFITGDDLFGLTEPAVLRIVESLPGVDTLYDYNFRYGRSPFLELPLAINPTGCARSEPKLRTHFKRPHTLHTSKTTSYFHAAFSGIYPEVSSSPYIKQFVHSKSSQYRKMKIEWRNNVYLARSRIQGLGLYAARDMEKHTMVIEYIGQLIRNELAERNEAIYTAQNRGVYMFRLDENRVIDATLCGGLARYINHSCNPNCVTETVQIDRDNKILIITNRRVSRGEELSYDYKFEVEDDQHKIPCLCGAPNCRKWMN